MEQGILGWAGAGGIVCSYRMLRLRTQYSGPVTGKDDALPPAHIMSKSKSSFSLILRVVTKQQGEVGSALLACSRCHLTDAAEAVRELDAVDALRVTTSWGETGTDGLRIDCGDGGCERPASSQGRGQTAMHCTDTARARFHSTQGVQQQDAEDDGIWRITRACSTSEGWRSSVSPSAAPPSSTHRLVRHCLFHAAQEFTGGLRSIVKRHLSCHVGDASSPPSGMPVMSPV